MTNDNVASDERREVVVVLNIHGVADAFGPYDEEEADEVAEFASCLVPTWRVTLSENERGDDGHVSRYGVTGITADKPQNYISHPTRGRNRA